MKKTVLSLAALLVLSASPLTASAATAMGGSMPPSPGDGWVHAPSGKHSGHFGYSCTRILRTLMK